MKIKGKKKPGLVFLKIEIKFEIKKWTKKVIQAIHHEIEPSTHSLVSLLRLLPRHRVWWEMLSLLCTRPPRITGEMAAGTPRTAGERHRQTRSRQSTC